MSGPAAAALALALALTTSACGDGSFSVQRSPAFPPSGATLSVFGVYKDGRMSPESWDSLRPRLGPILGANACETGYPEAANASSPELGTAVDDYTRANGVTEDLLEQLAPMAKGDLILLVMMTGRPHTGPDTSQPAPAPTTPAAPPARAGGRRGGYQGAGPGRAAIERGAFEVAASLYSVKTHRSVGAISMRYTGSSLDEALESFATHLADELPKASCGGWNAEVHVDPAKIRKLDSE
jgi:hypothetical protein